MRTNEEWKAIFADHEASGMTVKEYCKEHNIGVASFYKYKKLIMQSDELFNQATVIDEEIEAQTEEGIKPEVTSEVQETNEQ